MPRALTRGIAAAAAAAGLAAVGAANAGPPAHTPFDASFERGGTISFELVEKPTRKRVRAIEIHEMAATCEERAAKLDFIISGGTPVFDDRSFAVRSQDETGKGNAVVRGRFSRAFTRVRGSARLYGKFVLENDRSKCNTRRQDFVAKVSR